MPPDSPLARFIGQRRPRVLVVDDEPANLKVLSAHLTRWGCVVETAAGGAAALASVRAVEPDAVLLDVLMPGVSGLEVCEALQRDPATRHIPVVFLTALAREEAKVQGLGAGARDYLTKPFIVPELAARVGAVLREKFAEDALRARRDELLRRVARDPQTDAASRAGLEDAARALVAGDEEVWPLSLFLVDVDGLGSYNAARGRRAGDQALRFVADTIRAHARVGDLIGRHEADALACLLPAAPEAAAVGVAEQIRGRCESFQLMVSVGGTTLISPGDLDAAGILGRLQRAAAAALAQAQAAGGNRVVWG